MRLKEQGTGYFVPFYARRARRILPPYLVFLLAAGSLLSFPWARVCYWYVFFGANFPLALGKSTVEALTPLWSLAVEEQFYLVWPWIVLFCGTQTLRRVALATVLFSPVIRAVATPLFSSHFPIYCLTFFRADTLAFGAFLAAAQHEDGEWIRSRRRAGLVALISATSLFGLLAALPSFHPAANSVLFNSLGYSLSVIAFGGALVYVLTIQRGMVHFVLSAKPIRYLGQISYTFYLYHVAILQQTALQVKSPWARGMIGFAITLGVAAISWHLLEQPILEGWHWNWRIRPHATLRETCAPAELGSELP